MIPAIHRSHRGMSLLELMLALVITALVAGAICGMMGAVTTGVSTRRDNRTTMIGANAAAARLSAYIAPARCLLDTDGTNLVLWLHDERESGTVHATEIRWLFYDDATGTLDVYFVSFPNGWAKAAKDLEDPEYLATANWASIFNSYDNKGWTASMTLLDGLEGVAVGTDAFADQDSRHLNFDLLFETSGQPMEIWIAATIRTHTPPSS